MKNHEPDEPAIRPGQPVTIDFFRPEDADGVVRLFKTVYGENYPISTFIDPQRLREENAAGRTISDVARTPGGEIVAHNALFQSAPHDGLYETGAGLVLPSYRHTAGIISKLVRHGMEEAAPRFGLGAIFGEPVCNHVFMQKVVGRLNFVTCALEVDLMPAAAYVREGSASGRVAALLDFKTISPQPHTVYVPAAYRKTLEFIYRGLDDTRTFSMEAAAVPEDRDTRIKTEHFEFAQAARMAVHEAGEDFQRVLAAEEQRLHGKGVEIFQVWIRLSRPWCGAMVETLREKGYFLGGILPRWFGEDGLLMQKIPGTPNWNEIRLHTDRAKRLAELVQTDWSLVN